MSATDFCLFFLSKAAKWRGIPETASEAKMRPRSDLFVGHCKGRSPEAIRRYFFAVASEARQSHEIASPDEKVRLAMTGERTKRRARRDPFCASLRGPEARSNPADVSLALRAKQSSLIFPRGERRDCFTRRKSEARNDVPGTTARISFPRHSRSGATKQSRISTR